MPPRPLPSRSWALSFPTWWVWRRAWTSRLPLWTLGVRLDLALSRSARSPPARSLGTPPPDFSGLLRKKHHQSHGLQQPWHPAAVARLEKRQGTGIVGVNIGKNFDTPNEKAVDDYVICLRAAYPVADYIAVNISSPNTKGLRDLQAEEPIRRLVGTLKEEQQRLAARHGDKKPLLVKIAPDLDPAQIDSLVRVFTEQQLDGVIATNTTISREAVAGHRLAEEAGGLSGAPLTSRSTEVIATLRAALPSSMPIIGVGGIMTAAQAQAKLDAGAALVQVYTGLVYRGPALVRDIAALNVSGKK